MIGQTKPRDKQERRLLRERRIGAAEQRQPPNFIIIGAQKGGTTSLYRYLTEHPEIGGASKKEVHFFDRSYDKGMDWYLAHFPRRGEFPVVGEASPSYLFHPEVPGRVRRAVPDAKLIALLRNPVDRAFSQYQMNVRKGFEPLPFEEAIDREPERLRLAADRSTTQWRYSSYLARGLYAEHLEWWLAAFPRGQLLVLRSEDFFARPEEGLAEALAFLGLPPWRPDAFEVYNPGAYGGMRPETRARLAAFFAPHNRRLGELLGRDFGWDDA